MVKKYVCAALLILLVVPQFAGAQSNRRALPLKIVYPNQGTYPTSVSVLDSASNTADNVYIGVRGGRGDLAPISVTVTITTLDADASDNADSIQVQYSAGIQNQYATVGVLDTIGVTTHVRTFVFNVAGASSANNTQNSVFPYCDVIKLAISDAAHGAENDTFSYAIKAFGIYEDDRVMDYLKVQYPNKRSDADSMLSGTADVVYLGATSRGNLAPLGIGFSVVTSDADVSATPDTCQGLYSAGIGAQFTDITNSTYANELTAVGTFIKSVVFNTTGASTAKNTQAIVAPYFDAFKISLKNPSVMGDTTKYIIKALGVYKKGRIMERITVRYPNKGFSADTVLGTTLDSVYLRIPAKGDLSPIGLGLSFKATDVDVSANADSLLFLPAAGVSNAYANMLSGNYRMAAAPLSNASTVTGIWSLIFNTTGAATAFNTQSAVVPHFQDLWLRLKADDSGDSTKYEIKAIGIYQQQAH